MNNKNQSSPIHVYSEIGQLKKVLVHKPGNEIKYITPDTMEELLFNGLLEPNQVAKEHDEFVKILKNEGVEVVYLEDLVLETFQKSSESARDDFIRTWIRECEVRETKILRIINKYIRSLSPREMIQKMFSGILASDIDIESYSEIIVKPMPNSYFTRDVFSSVGCGIVFSRMKYPIRRRESIFSRFIFRYHPDYKNTPLLFDHDSHYSIEGGDIFVYNDKTLVVGVSERTEFDAIKILAENLMKNDAVDFNKIYCIYVPHEKNLMHLDTWLTMIDHNKFLYSPNMLKQLKVWEISLTNNELQVKLLKKNLRELLKLIIKKEPILIPVGGGKSQMRIDIETYFDASNFLAIRPGVVIGYDRNIDTIAEMKKHGIKVLAFSGNQLSLGMGSARCMTMPLWREDIK